MKFSSKVRDEAGDGGRHFHWGWWRCGLRFLHFVDFFCASIFVNKDKNGLPNEWRIGWPGKLM